MGVIEMVIAEKYIAALAVVCSALTVDHDRKFVMDAIADVWPSHDESGWCIAVVLFALKGVPSSPVIFRDDKW
jgi:hypothetical protein